MKGELTATRIVVAPSGTQWKQVPYINADGFCSVCKVRHRFGSKAFLECNDSHFLELIGKLPNIKDAIAKALTI